MHPVCLSEFTVRRLSAVDKHGIPEDRHVTCGPEGFAPMPEHIHDHLPVVATLLVFIARMREVSTKRDVIPGKTRETLTFNLFMVCGLLMVAGGIAEFYLAKRGLWWGTFVPGLILSLASIWIRRSAIRALGRFW